MIRRIDLRDGPVTTEGPSGAAHGAGTTPDYRTLVPRADFDVEAALHVVRPICDDVRERGVEAIAEDSERFDGVTQTDITVPREALTDALANLDPQVRAGLEESIRRLRITCEAEL